MSFIFLDFGYWIALAAIYYYFSLSCVNISNICLGVISLDRQTVGQTHNKKEVFHNPEKLKEPAMFCLCCIIVE